MADEAIVEDVTTGADDGAGAAAEVAGGKETVAAVETAAKAEGGSEALLDGALEGDAEPAKGDWPDDWRERLAGDDEAAKKRLARFGSPRAIFDSLRAAEKKISAGEAKKAVGADAKPEEIEAWRKENNLPITPEDMLKAAPDPEGFVFGEADKPYLDNYAKAVLAANGTPDEVARGKAVYARMMEDAQQQRAEADKAYHAEALDNLRDEFGSGAAVKAELNGVQNFLDSHFSEEARKEILGGRGASGNLLRNNPAFLRDLAALSREIAPAASLMPAGTVNAAKAMGDEIAAIEKEMATDINAYYRDAAKQARYRELIEARDKIKSRAA